VRPGCEELEDVVDGKDAGQPAALIHYRHAPDVPLAHRLQGFFDGGMGGDGHGMPRHDVFDRNFARVGVAHDDVGDDVAVGQHADRAFAAQSTGGFDHHEAADVSLAHHPCGGA
jgi:hypothetical protein